VAESVFRGDRELVGIVEARVVERALLVVPHHALDQVGVEVGDVVARAGEEQHLTGVHEDGVHRQHVRVDRQELPVAGVGQHRRGTLRHAGELQVTKSSVG